MSPEFFHAQHLSDAPSLSSNQMLLGIVSLYPVPHSLFTLQRDRRARAPIYYRQSCARGILTPDRIARTSEAIRFTVPSQADIVPLTSTTWLLSSRR